MDPKGQLGFNHISLPKHMFMIHVTVLCPGCNDAEADVQNPAGTEHPQIVCSTCGYSELDTRYKYKDMLVQALVYGANIMAK